MTWRTCPNCQKVLDETTGAEGIYDYPLEVGDLTVCGHCVAVLELERIPAGTANRYGDLATNADTLGGDGTVPVRATTRFRVVSRHEIRELDDETYTSLTKLQAEIAGFVMAGSKMAISWKHPGPNAKHAAKSNRRTP